MYERVSDIIICRSLVDLSKTGVTGIYKKNSHISEQDWDFRRNQQRNWETMLQLIALRAQPIYLEDPTVLEHQDLTLYKFGPIYQGYHRVWEFKFASEHPSVFGHDLSLLSADVHNVPINTNLSESARFNLPVFDCLYHHNVYFTIFRDYKYQG